MATFTETLLRLDPRDAIVAMINEENGTKFQRDELEISSPIALSDRLTRVVVTARKAAMDPDIDRVIPNGSINYEYHRIDIGNYYNGMLSGFYPPLPTSTQILVNELHRLTQHVFVVEDFVLENIQNENAANYILKAKTESLRFVGSMVVDVLDLEPLDDITVDNDTLLATIRPTLRSYSSALPYIDGAYLPVNLSLLDFTQEVQYSPLLRNFLTTTLHHTTRLHSLDYDEVSEAAQWVAEENEGTPFNYWDATAVLIDGGNWHPLIGDYNKIIKFTFRDTDKVFLDDPEVYIPLLEYQENKAVFSNDGRFQLNNALHGSDGTYINNYLNSLPVNYVISTTDVSIDFTQMDAISGRSWIISQSPYDFNLLDAVIVYNDKRLPHHGTSLSPNNDELTRAIVFAISPTYNTLFEGNLVILYRPPVKSIPSINDSQNENTYYQEFLLRSLNGAEKAPYSATVIQGNLAPGHTLVQTDPAGQYAITGTSSVPGEYSFTLRVSNVDGEYTDYRYRYRNYEIPLQLYGQAADGIVGNIYSFTYTTTGGYGPYSYSFSQGNCPLVLNTDTGEISGTPTIAGNYSWRLVCIDSRGNATAIDDDFVIRND